MPAEATSGLSYQELVDIYDANCQPFDDLAQVRRFLKAASILYRLTPSETEGEGQRIIKADIWRAIQDAQKAEAVFRIGGQGATVIVPSDDLR